MGFRKGDDFCIALGGGKISAWTVVNKVMQRLKSGEAVAGDETEARLAGVLEGHDERQRRTQEASNYGIVVQGIDDVMVRLAKCCRPGAGGRDRRLRLARSRDHDPSRGLPERQGADEVPGAVHRRLLGGENAASYRVELQVDAWDRTRLLEDLSRTFAEAGVNIIEARCSTKHPMVRNRFVVEVGDSQQLGSA